MQAQSLRVKNVLKLVGENFAKMNFVLKNYRWNLQEFVYEILLLFFQQNIRDMASFKLEGFQIETEFRTVQSVFGMAASCQSSPEMYVISIKRYFKL